MSFLRFASRVKDFFANRTGRVFRVALLCFFLTVLALYTIRRVAKENTDFDGFYHASRIIIKGNFENIYEGTAIKNYTPSFPILFIPFAVSKNIYVSFLIFYSANLIIAYFLFRILHKMFRERKGVYEIAIVGAVIINFAFIVDCFILGQLHIIILFLLILSLYFLRRAQIISGLLIALATAMKVIPGIFLVWLILKKRWFGLVGFFVGCLLFFYVVPGFVYGFKKSETMLKEWRQKRAEHFAKKGEIVGGYSRFNNQSLLAFLARFLKETGTGAGRYPGTKERVYLNFVNLGEKEFRYILWFFSGLFLLSSLIALIKSHPIVKREEFDKKFNLTIVDTIDFSIFLILMVILSPIAWTHYFCLLMIPVFILFIVWQINKEFKKTGELLFTIFFFLLLISIHPLYRMFGSLFLGVVIIFAALIIYKLRYYTVWKTTNM